MSGSLCIVCVWNVFVSFFSLLLPVYFLPFILLRSYPHKLVSVSGYLFPVVIFTASIYNKLLVALFCSIFFACSFGDILFAYGCDIYSISSHEENSLSCWFRWKKIVREVIISRLLSSRINFTSLTQAWVFRDCTYIVRLWIDMFFQQHPNQFFLSVTDT